MEPAEGKRGQGGACAGKGRRRETRDRDAGPCGAQRVGEPMQDGNGRRMHGGMEIFWDAPIGHTNMGCRETLVVAQVGKSGSVMAVNSLGSTL